MREEKNELKTLVNRSRLRMNQRDIKGTGIIFLLCFPPSWQHFCLYIRRKPFPTKNTSRFDHSSVSSYFFVNLFDFVFFFL